MDSYKKVEDVLNGKISHRQNKELQKISNTPTRYTLPYRATYQKSVGEFGPSKEDKLNVKFKIYHR